MAMSFTPIRWIPYNAIGFGSISAEPTNWGEAAVLNAAGIHPGMYGACWLVSVESGCMAVPIAQFEEEYEVLSEEEFAALRGGSPPPPSSES